MKKISLLLLSAALSMGVYAQKLDKTTWSDGEMGIYCYENDGTTFTFSVGYAHDGGGDLKLRKVKENVFEAVNPDAYKYGATYVKATLKTINCPGSGITKYLYFEDKNGKMLGVMPQMTDDYGGETIETDVLAGTYKGSDGKTYIFSGKSLIINGQSSDIEPLKCEMGYVNGFKYKGQKYCFRISENGINLYTTTTDDGEFEYEPEKLWVKLTIDQEKNQGRWAITKNKIVMSGYVGYFSKSLCRVMRNEIYARHGYNFASADLKAHFSKMSWYKPVADNSKIQLSELEQLNIAILKLCEDTFTWSSDNIEK